jgi:hypothetical protein
MAGWLAMSEAYRGDGSVQAMPRDVAAGGKRAGCGLWGKGAAEWRRQRPGCSLRSAGAGAASHMGEMEVEVTGYRSQVAGRRSQIADRRLQVGAERRQGGSAARLRDVEVMRQGGAYAKPSAAGRRCLAHGGGIRPG